MKTVLVAHYPATNVDVKRKMIDKAIANYRHGKVDAVRDPRRKPENELAKAKDFLKSLGHPTYNLSKKQLLERYDDAMDVTGGYWAVSNLGLQYMTTNNPYGEWSSWSFVDSSTALEDKNKNYVTSILAKEMHAFTDSLIDSVVSERNWKNRVEEDWDKVVYGFLKRQMRDNSMVTLIEVNENKIG